MALARQPKLLILDEPTNGLDPAGIEEMRAGLLRRLANNGVTVMSFLAPARRDRQDRHGARNR